MQTEKGWDIDVRVLFFAIGIELASYPEAHTLAPSLQCAHDGLLLGSVLGRPALHDSRSAPQSSSDQPSTSHRELPGTITFIEQPDCSSEREQRENCQCTCANALQSGALRHDDELPVSCQPMVGKPNDANDATGVQQQAHTSYLSSSAAWAGGLGGLALGIGMTLAIQRLARSY